STQAVPSAATSSRNTVPVTMDPVLAIATAQQAATAAATAQRRRLRFGMGARSGRRIASPGSVIYTVLCATTPHSAACGSFEDGDGRRRRSTDCARLPDTWKLARGLSLRCEARPKLLSLAHLVLLSWLGESGGHMSEPLVLPLAPGDPQQLGGHRLIGLLGHGGMGRVYLRGSPDRGPGAVKGMHPPHAAGTAFRPPLNPEAGTA